MDSEKINKADREFVRKLHRLRSELDERQKKNANRSAKKVYRNLITLIISLLLLAGAVFAIINKEPEFLPTISRKETNEGDRIQAPQPEPAGPMDEPRPERNENPIEPEPVENQPSEPPNKLPMASEENLTSKAESEQNHTIAIRPAQQVAKENDIELVSAVVCQGVQNHQYIEKRDVFYTSNTRRAYVWMEVRSKEQPFVIKHIYYLNGQKYCEVPLDIKYMRMRTWSYVTLGKEDQAGSWKVEIVCNNRVLKTVRFMVRS